MVQWIKADFTSIGLVLRLTKVLSSSKTNMTLPKLISQTVPGTKPISWADVASSGVVLIRDWTSWLLLSTGIFTAKFFPVWSSAKLMVMAWIAWLGDGRGYGWTDGWGPRALVVWGLCGLARIEVARMISGSKEFILAAGFWCRIWSFCTVGQIELCWVSSPFLNIRDI